MLPLEIYTHITDALDADYDTRTLCNCSLVCRSLRRVCQRYLFRSILLLVPSKVSRVLELAEILHNNNQITSHISSLRLNVDFDDSISTPEADDGLASLELCLRQSTISELNLDIMWYSFEKPPRWDFISPSRRLALEGLILSSPLLHSLNINGITLPYHVLPSLQVDPLKVLIFQGPDPDGGEEEDPPGCVDGVPLEWPPVRTPPLRIEEMQAPLDEVLPLLESAQPDGTPVVDNTSVRVLQLTTDRIGNYKALPKLLAKTCDLAQLKIDLWSATDDLHILLSGVRFQPAFRSLVHLDIHLGGSRRAKRVLFHGLFDILSTFPVDNSLSVLKINTILAILPSETEPEWSNRRNAEWSNALHTLTPTAFPYLTLLGLNIVFIDRRIMDRDGRSLAEQIKEASFSSLKSRGVEVVFDVWYSWEGRIGIDLE